MVIKNILIIFLTFIFLIVEIFAFTPPIHNANGVLIDVDGTAMNLQEAISNNFLKDWMAGPSGFSSVGYDKSTNEWHSGGDVQVYLKNVGSVSLQDSVNRRTSDRSFCRDSENPIWSFIFGHGSDKIIFSDDETLQEKINTQQFCSYEWVEGGFNICTASACSTPATQTVNCVRSDGTTMTGTDEAFCTETEPLDSKSCLSFCTYAWSYGDFGDCPTDTCHDESTLTRTATCIRSDGTTMTGTDESTCGTQDTLTKTCTADISGCCGDGLCEAARSETCSTCETDCGACPVAVSYTWQLTETLNGVPCGGPPCGGCGPSEALLIGQACSTPGATRKAVQITGQFSPQCGAIIRIATCQ